MSSAPAMSRVPFVDLNRQHAPIADELTDAFSRVLGTSGFILGEEVERFEDDFAAFCSADHCAGVASGTAALVLAIRALGVGPGDEVIVPAHTFIASVLGIIHAGATPVFCDVHEDTGLIDPASAAAVVGPRTAAIVAVHLYGQTCEMDALTELAAAHGLALIEDAAQAHGATYRGRPAGSLGTVACFSFYPSKNLGALGDGGAVVTGDEHLAARVRQLRHLGQRRKGEHEVLGYNERLDGLQAAFLRVKLGHLDGWNQARQAHAARYRHALPPELRLVVERAESPSVHHVFGVRVGDREAFAARLHEAGVSTAVHYSPAAHRHTPCADAGRTPVSLVRSEAWAAEQLSLPMFEHMTNEEIDRVADACVRALS